MKAAEIAIKPLTQTKENIHVHLKMDNVTAVTYLNKMGGTKSCILNSITKIWEHCMLKKIIVTAEYLPGCQNSIADWESRNVQEVSINSWRLNPTIFNQINKNTGTYQITPICRPMECSGSPVHQLEKRPISSLSGCFSNNLGEGKEGICLSSILHDSQLSIQT